MDLVRCLGKLLTCHHVLQCSIFREMEEPLFVTKVINSYLWLCLKQKQVLKYVIPKLHNEKYKDLWKQKTRIVFRKVMVLFWTTLVKFNISWGGTNPCLVTKVINNYLSVYRLNNNRIQNSWGDSHVKK